jgi:hypothetical protein
MRVYAPLNSIIGDGIELSVWKVGWQKMPKYGTGVERTIITTVNSEHYHTESERLKETFKELIKTQGAKRRQKRYQKFFLFDPPIKVFFSFDKNQSAYGHKWMLAKLVS